MKQGSGSEAIVAVTAVFLAISLLTVSLRCYVRLRVVRAFGWDDGFMVVAMTLNVAFAICGFIGASYGMGGSPDIALYQPGDIKNALLVCGDESSNPRPESWTDSTATCSAGGLARYSTW